MRRVIFTDDQGAGSVLVDAVYDPRAHHAVDAGKAVAAVEHHRIDEGAAVMPRSGVNDHILRFIDHKDVLVLIQDVQRDVLRRDIGFCVLRKGKRHFIPVLHPVACLRRLSVYKTHLPGNHLLNIRTGQRIDTACDKSIDALPAAGFRHFKFKFIHSLFLHSFRKNLPASRLFSQSF